MFLRRVSSSGSAFLRRCPPALHAAGFRAASPFPPGFIAAPPPRWQAQGFPPRPPRPAQTRPPAFRGFPSCPTRPASAPAGDLAGGRRSLHASAGLRMDGPGRCKEPPRKRKKKASAGERGAHGVGTSGQAAVKPKAGAGPRGNRLPNPTKHAGRGSGRAGRHQNKVPPKPLQRRWEAFPARSTQARPPGGGNGSVFDFSVLSYNILSQQLLQDNAYLYRHCDPSVLPWDYRLPVLLSEIQSHDADILCLQEVQEDHYENQIKPALQAKGYHCEYKKRTGRKPDGCAVVFKTSRLSLLSSNPIEFFRPGDPLLDRDNVGLVLLLRPNTDAGSDPSAAICVANTHLLYNPRRGDVKLAQLAILLAEINRLARLPDGSSMPVVLCGDFNSTPWSPLYNFLTTGCLQYKKLQIGQVSGQENSPTGQRRLTGPIWSQSLGINHQCRYESGESAESSDSSQAVVGGAASGPAAGDQAAKASFNRTRIEHSLKLRSSYQHRLKPDGRPEITTCHSRTAITVDYILYTPEPTASPPLPGGRGLQLLGRLSLVGQPELVAANSLPNREHSSDHLPLLARFRYQCGAGVAGATRDGQSEHSPEQDASPAAQLSEEGKK